MDYSAWSGAYSVPSFDVDGVADPPDDTGTESGSFRGGLNEALVFAIDCASSMFEVHQSDNVGYLSGRSNFDRSLECVKYMMRKKVIMTPKDLVAVVLYRTREQVSDYKFPGVFVYHHFHYPDVKHIAELTTLAESTAKPDQGGVSSFEEKIGSTANPPDAALTANLLWTLANLFGDIRRDKKSLASCRVWFFTDDDNPLCHAPPAAFHRQLNACAEHGRALRDHHVSLHLFPLRRIRDCKSAALTLKEQGGLASQDSVSVAAFDSSGGVRGGGHADSTVKQSVETYHGASRSSRFTDASMDAGALHSSVSASAAAGLGSGSCVSKHERDRGKAFSKSRFSAASFADGSASVASFTDRYFLPFDVALFWDKVVLQREGDDIMDADWATDAEEHEVTVKSYGKRSAGSVNLCLGSSAMAVNIFHCVHAATKPTPIWISVNTGEPLKTATNFKPIRSAQEMTRHSDQALHGGALGDLSLGGMLDDPMADINSSATNFSATFGGALLGFTVEDRDLLRTVGNTLVQSSVQILCFRDAATFPKLSHSVGETLFLAPNENLAAGSESLFATLHARMIEKKMNAHVLALVRGNSRCIPAALIPLPDKEASHWHESPGGVFALFPLPYGDEIRKFEFRGEDEPPPEKAVELFRSVAEQLTLNYVPRAVPNPVLDKFHCGLEALALGAADVPPLVDFSLPDTDGIISMCGDDLTELVSMLYSDNYDPIAAAGALGAPKAGGVKRRPAAAVAVDGPTDLEVRDAITDGALERYTIPNLKAVLKRHGAPVSGTKPVLVHRILGLLEFADIAAGAADVAAEVDGSGDAVANAPAQSEPVDRAAKRRPPPPPSPSTSSDSDDVVIGPSSVVAGAGASVNSPSNLPPSNVPPCKYGASCYRRNPNHLRLYYHPPFE